MIDLGVAESSKFINQMAKHEELPVPIFSTLEPVYGDGSQLEEAQIRFDKLKHKFIEVFGHQPDVYARSPGLPLLSSFNCKITYDC